MRYRRVAYRYTEIVGALSGHFEAELRALARPQSLATPLWRPHADVFETQAALHVTVEIPGVTEEDLDVALFADALVVTGRRRPFCAEGAFYHASEIRCGPFHFDLALPFEVNPEDVEASLERGLLRIVLHKRTQTA